MSSGSIDNCARLENLIMCRMCSAYIVGCLWCFVLCSELEAFAEEVDGSNPVVTTYVAKEKKLV